MSKLKYGTFKKKDYIKVMNEVVDKCMEIWGYKRRPKLIETKLMEGGMMAFYDHGHSYAILYDYDQFRRAYQQYDYQTAEAFATLMVAHEMRHYYQVRQIYAKRPKQGRRTVAAWRKNHFFRKYNAANCPILKYYLQPMELDAQLFGYYYVAKTLDRAVKLDFIDKNFIKIMRKKYVKMFGRRDEDLYIFDQNI